MPATPKPSTPTPPKIQPVPKPCVPWSRPRRPGSPPSPTRAPHPQQPARARYLAVAVPMLAPSNQPAAIAPAVPSPEVLQPVWRKERVILVYLLVNALVLAAVVVFFRLFQSHVRPIDRMVEAAEATAARGWTRSGPRPRLQCARRLAAPSRPWWRASRRTANGWPRPWVNWPRRTGSLLANQEEMVRAEKLASVGQLAARPGARDRQSRSAWSGLCAAARHGQPGHIRARRLRGQGAGRAGAGGPAHPPAARPRRAGRGRPGHSTRTTACETAESLASQPLFAGIRVTLDLAAARSRVHLDREQLRQVLLNCLLNSVDAIRSHRSAGEGAITLATRIDPPDEPIIRRGCASFIDNGSITRTARVGVRPLLHHQGAGPRRRLGLWVSLSLINPWAAPSAWRANPAQAPPCTCCCPDRPGRPGRTRHPPEPGA